MFLKSQIACLSQEGRGNNKEEKCKASDVVAKMAFNQLGPLARLIPWSIGSYTTYIDVF